MKNSDSISGLVVRDLRAGENRDQPPIEICGQVREAVDLNVEANHVLYLDALLFSRIFPSFDDETHRLETALWHQPKGTVNKLVASASQVYEAFDQSLTVLLNGFESVYLTERDTHV